MEAKVRRAAEQWEQERGLAWGWETRQAGALYRKVKGGDDETREILELAGAKGQEAVAKAFDDHTDAVLSQ